MQNSAMMASPIRLANGATGVSTISRAAGRNSCSCRLGADTRLNNNPVASANFMKPRLHPVEAGVAAAIPDQFVMGAVLDQPAILDGDDSIRAPHGRQPMGDDDDRAALRDRRHVLLNDAL